MSIIFGLFIPEIDICITEHSQIQAQSTALGSATRHNHNCVPCHFGHFCGLTIVPTTEFNVYRGQLYNFEFKITKLLDPYLDGPFYPPKV